MGRGNKLIVVKMAVSTEREFPRPRCGSVMFVYDHQLFLWGGMTQIILGEGDDRFLVDIDLPGMSLSSSDYSSHTCTSFSWLYYNMIKNHCYRF